MTTHTQNSDENTPKVIGFIVGGVMLAALFTGIVQGVVMVFQTLLPFLVFFFSAVLFLMLILITLGVIVGIQRAAKGELGSSLHEFSCGLRGLPPTQPRLSYKPVDSDPAAWTIDAVPAEPAAPVHATMPRDAVVSPTPSPDVISSSDEQHEILLLRADVMDIYVQHMDRIAAIYPYEKFVADIDSNLYVLAESYRDHLETVRGTVERALKIATIIDLRQEAVRAYNKAPHAIRSKLPMHIVRDQILTMYHQRFSLELIRKRHRSLLQKIESVALQVKEAGATEATLAVDEDARRKNHERKSLEQACRRQAKENVRKVLPSMPRDLVDEEAKRLFHNALQLQEQGDSHDIGSIRTCTTAA